MVTLPLEMPTHKICEFCVIYKLEPKGLDTLPQVLDTLRTPKSSLKAGYSYKVYECLDTLFAVVDCGNFIYWDLVESRKGKAKQAIEKFSKSFSKPIFFLVRKDRPDVESLFENVDRKVVHIE